MKKLNIKLSVLAIVLGVSAAYASKSEVKKDTHLWGKQSNGVWLNIDGRTESDTPPYSANSYRCDESTNSCTVQAATQPATNSNPTGAKPGTFSINN